MGTYYALVNLTKKQRYEPANGAVKHGNFVWFAEEMVELLLGSWIGDKVVMCSDSFESGPYYDSLGGEDDDGNPIPGEPEWPVVRGLYDRHGKVDLDSNGMTKLLAKFVEAFGADKVRVALDAAIEKAEP